MRIVWRALNLVAMAVYGVGLAAVGTFWTNTRIIGVRDSELKEPLIVANVAVWPLAGLADIIFGHGGPGGFLFSLLRVGSRGWLWRAFFTAVGARYLVQQARMNSRPKSLPEGVTGRGETVRSLHSEIAEAEPLGKPRSALGMRIYRINEVYSLAVSRYDVVLPNLPPEFEGFTIAQISDLHYGDFTSDTYVRACVDTALSLNPDLIALTGDFQHYEKDIQGAGRLLQPVGEWSRKERGGMGAYAVLGNHDTWSDPAAVTQALRDAGIPVLHNRHIELTRQGASLYIAGVADPWSLRSDLDLALDGVPKGACVVLLAHVPDTLVEVSERGVALQLSGHLHGGQIVLPFVGAMLSPSRYNRRYVSGWYRRGDTLLYTCRGLGGHPPIRLNATPEIPLFTLRTAKQRPAPSEARGDDRQTRATHKSQLEP